MAKFLFFGRFSDLSGDLSLDLPDTVQSSDDLIPWLDAHVAGVVEMLARPGSRVAINKELIVDNSPISNSDEIAFMSALSGG